MEIYVFIIFCYIIKFNSYLVSINNYKQDVNILSKLFIIGNGFDLAHGIPSTFNHFKEYLRVTYSYDYNHNMPNLWLESITGPDGDEIYNIDNCAQIIDFMICNASENLKRGHGENWNEFEKVMGEFDYRLIEYDITTQYDKEGDENIFITSNNYEDAYNDLENVMSNLPGLFAEWINKIPIPENCFSVSNLETYYSFSELIDADEDIFFTFNYTDTLESLYNAENVTHIHGTQDSDIIVGHSKYRNFEELAYNQDIQMRLIHNAFEKPTTRIIEENSDFFEGLEGEVDSIYSYGFSFEEVDIVYIKEIMNNIDTSDVTWYLHSYQQKEHEKFKKTIRECGFLGIFSEF